ncbi:hypothetical protein PPACK8108_LOCUS3018 [Phakopsora pachyrhizi]|uniref:Uncharacterized protein n=1 Tax=Phakopsora pachyrhizi TaxID=170000 RepID=A0AAV0AJ65_PHAPC|nr:hypothetical protein PPACK8108_LOCUS3018 [Phakopsora pachyrhizi]
MSENKGNTHPYGESSHIYLTTGLATTKEHRILTNHGIALDFGHWFGAGPISEGRQPIAEKTFGNKGVDSEERGGGDTALERGDESGSIEETKKEEGEMKKMKKRENKRKQHERLPQRVELNLGHDLLDNGHKNGWSGEKILIEGTIISSFACKEFIIDLRNLDPEKACWLLSAMLDLDWGLSVDFKMTVLQQMLAKNGG